MLTLDDVLAPARNVISRESGGELVIVLPERGKFLVLNATGAEVFRLIDGRRSLREIADALGEHFGVSVEQARSDVLSLVARLIDRGAVERCAPLGEDGLRPMC